MVAVDAAFFSDIEFLDIEFLAGSVMPVVPR
jgi:hypothetical protein